MDIHMIKKQLTSVYRFAYTNLALNYYTYFETVAEKTSAQDKLSSYTSRFNQLLGEVLENKGSIEDLDQMRNQLSGVIEVLNAYVDGINVYEYVLNRLERRFVTGVKIQESEEEVVSKVMQYIWNSKDTVVINGRIMEVIGQLPIRLTRNKFYNMVSDSLSIYIDGDRSALDNMMYLLRTSSLVQVPDDMEKGMEELCQMLLTLKEADYTALTEEEYKKLSRIIEEAVQMVTDLIGDCISLMELVNDLYMIELTQKDAFVDVEEEDVLKYIISGVLEKFKKEDWTEIDDDITGKLVFLEGRQEKLYEKYLKYESADEFVEEPYKDILRKIAVLLSGSSFASLEEMEDADEKADRRYVEKTAENYFEELNRLFQGMKKPVVRAVMSQALSKLPVCFNSAHEIESYIRSSLDSCTHICEKETCMELLLELVESENAYI